MARAQIPFVMVMYLWRIIFLTIVTVVSLALITSHLNTLVDTSEAEKSIFLFNLLYNEEIMEYDPILNRVYPSEVDVNSMKQQDFSQKLHETMFFGDFDKLAAKIQIMQGAELASVIYNPGEQNGYEEYSVLADSKIPGKGGVKASRHVQPVIVEGQHAKLDATILQRRS